MIRIVNLVSGILMKDNLFVAVLNGVRRYSVAFVSEYIDTILEAIFTEVVGDILSSDYLPSRSRESYLRNV